MKQTGRLESWKIDPIFNIIWGFIYEDERKRWPDGTWIHTSSIDHNTLRNTKLKKGDVVKTLNSSYELGEPLLKNSKEK